MSFNYTMTFDFRFSLKEKFMFAISTLKATLKLSEPKSQKIRFSLKTFFANFVLPSIEMKFA